MTRVRLEGVSKRFGKVVAVDRVSLEVEEGELFTILGPSGCGKTTLLRIIAGLEFPDEGRVFFDDVDVTTRRSYERGTALVFQTWALWPHMTVRENIEYGLRIRRIPRSEIDERVRWVVELLKLEGLEDRYPHQLSGGQQQRVALARALVVQPKVLLLDEPLSNLDARLRVEVREEVRRIVKRLGITTIYVTHDQEEALAISDRVAVMNNGRILQIGRPNEVYLRPKDLFVATFVGRANVVRGRALELLEDSTVLVDTTVGILRGTALGEVSAGDAVAVVFRPESVKVGATGDNVLEGVVSTVQFVGPYKYVRVNVSGVEIGAMVPAVVLINEGDRLRISFDTNRTLVYKLSRRD